MEIAHRQRESHSDQVFDAICKMAFGCLVLAGIVCFFVFVFAPWINRSDTAATRHFNQELAAIHRLGFTKVTPSMIVQNDGSYDPTYFTYSVGSCTATIDVMRVAGQYKLYRTYIWLKSVNDTRVFVTSASLQKLPQLAGCFVK